MTDLKWLFPTALSFAFGLLYVQFLTIHPLRMSRYLLAATLAFVAAVASLVVGFQGEYSIPIDYTGPLYDSETLQSMFVHRANKNRGETDKSKVGILLVGHGQPDEWDVEWATETEQEINFRQEVLKRFEADGYKRGNLSLAWMEFKEPRPAVKVEEFSRNGVEKVLFFSAAISADAMHSQYDVPALVNEARVPASFSVVNSGAWNDDPIVIQAIKEKIDALMN